MDHFAAASDILLANQTLDQDTAYGLFTDLFEGTLNASQIGAALAMLAMHHPTSDELTGAARAMRERVTAVEYTRSPGSILIDTCGTGGAPKTFNVSTIAAMILAGVQPTSGSDAQRIQIAKHGNRSRTGRGSAEVLMQMGVNVDASTEIQSKCLDQAGLCFCFAVNHHPAIKHAMPTRRSLSFPTIFNAIGPLTNPAGADCQLIGVYKNELVEPMAQTLVNLGTKRAMVVHSTDGLDELSTTAPTRAVQVSNGTLTELEIDATAFGLKRTTVEELKARDVAHSAEIAQSVLSNEASPYLDMALLTVAGALVAAGVCDGFREGIELGRDAVSSGRAREALDGLIAISNS